MLSGKNRNKKKIPEEKIYNKKNHLQNISANKIRHKKQ